MTWLVDADVTEPVIATGVNASGGTESVIRVGGQLYRVHKFTSNGTFTVSNGGVIETLLVGGGGAGGRVLVSSTIGAINLNLGGFAGGGGAGAVLSANVALSSGSFSVVVGAQTSTSGNDSYIQNGGTDVIRAKGGGRGGTLEIVYTSSIPSVSRIDGENGGSGGGSMGHTSGFNVALGGSGIGTGVIAQGNNGGFFSPTGGGGGGGVAAVGFEGLQNTGGNGGNGLSFFIDGTLATYAAGGGAAGFSTNGIGGVGGGGAGANMGGTLAKVDGSDAQPNTGSGGGGGAYGANVHIGTDAAFGGKGASGIVIIRYPIEG